MDWLNQFVEYRLSGDIFSYYKIKKLFRNILAIGVVNYETASYLHSEFELELSFYHISRSPDIFFFARYFSRQINPAQYFSIQGIVLQNVHKMVHAPYAWLVPCYYEAFPIPDCCIDAI